jgi:predicted phosphodiesterase
MLLLLVIISASAQPYGNSTTYSIIHISDTQHLASDYPETYNYTFSYLDSIKGRYNISAIIITGDLVNTPDNKKQWDTYTQAIRKTSIPIYVIAGNHDTDFGENYQYFTQYTGNTKDNYVTRLQNFDLVGINYVDDSLESEEFAAIRKTLLSAPENYTIIATHFYMDENGNLSPLGTDIDEQLIVKPTIIMGGHIHADFVRDRVIGQYPVIEDLTNYQDGIPNGSPSENVSAGTFYTITTRDGQVEKISARIIWISPRQSFDSEHVLYDILVPEPDPEPSIPEVTPECDSTSGICGTPTIPGPWRYWNSLFEFLKGLFRFS